MADFAECALHEMIGCVTCDPRRRHERMARRRGGGTGGEATVEFGVGCVLLSTPYHEDFVAELKEAVPARHRRWMPDARVWEISEEYWADVASLVEDYFSLVE